MATISSKTKRAISGPSIFIRDSHGIEEVTNDNQAYSAGKAFGYFQFQLSDLSGSQLIETIPNFHSREFRYQQLRQAIEENRAGRLRSIRAETDRLLARAEKDDPTATMARQPGVALRITHNDTKINNVLYDQDDNILCIIDLDTVMPGSALFDFSDAIRTLGNKASEDEPDLTKIDFNAAYYTAFAKGYIAESGTFLTQKEERILVLVLLNGMGQGLSAS